MVVDGGSGFFSWRGESQLERLCGDYGIDFIKASKRGSNSKLEALNANVRKELLSRVEFADVASGRIEVARWVRGYNCERVHEGLGGLLVPGDRYFGTFRPPPGVQWTSDGKEVKVVIDGRTYTVAWQPMVDVGCTATPARLSAHRGWKVVDTRSVPTLAGSLLDGRPLHRVVLPSAADADIGGCSLDGGLEPQSTRHLCRLMQLARLRCATPRSIRSDAGP